jgi:hypothetical protein
VHLAPLDISADEAREKLAEYTAVLAGERTAEDEAIAMGYRAAARGLPIIRLSQAVAAGGYFDSGLPRIAVIRATEKDCYARWDGNSIVYNDGVSRNQGALVGKWTVRVPIAEPPARRRWGGGQTIAPLIPPRYRPRWPRLKSCHLLWEVESWTPVPPRDPALLRHIRGDLWAVLAVWDLTELERYVLSQRM